jgi:hypothetical protein
VYGLHGRALVNAADRHSSVTVRRWFGIAASEGSRVFHPMSARGAISARIPLCEGDMIVRPDAGGICEFAVAAHDLCGGFWRLDVLARR